MSGNESYKVGGATHSRSLSLPSGSAAVSPFTCVGLSEPTLRLFAKRNSALLGLVSTLNVQIQVQTSLGLSVWLPVLPGDLGGSSWHPTAKMPLIANILPLSASDKTPVRFRFSPLLGSWQIDDVYVDPFMDAARRARPNPAARRTSPGAASAGTGTAPASRGADRDRDRPPAPRARPAVPGRGSVRRGRR